MASKLASKNRNFHKKRPLFIMAIDRGYFLNSITSLGVQDNMSQSVSNVAVVIFLLCFRLYIVFDCTLYFSINVYVVMCCFFIVFHRGLYETILHRLSDNIIIMAQNRIDYTDNNRHILLLFFNR